MPLEQWELLITADELRCELKSHSRAEEVTIVKTCVVGAGAIGGLIGARLSAAGEAQVSALARGSSLRALCANGWRLVQGGQLIQSPVRASDDPTQLGVQDVIIVALKSPALTGVAPQLKPLIGSETIVVSCMNGVPWWFSVDFEKRFGHVLQTVNPNGLMSSIIPYAQTVGGVIHASAFRSRPGLVHHTMGTGIVLGEVEGGRSSRVEHLRALLAHAGFDATHSDNIRADVWYKLWGNMTINPVSAITGATADRILSDVLVRQFCSKAMEEAAAIGAKMGYRIDQAPDDRHRITAQLGSFKTSMLQDVETNQAIELDALLGAVREIGAALGIATPYVDAIFGLTRLFARTKGLYPESSAVAESAGW
jgi:2-dehydropantoate 2-reductase